MMRSGYSYHVLLFTLLLMTLLLSACSHSPPVPDSSHPQAWLEPGVSVTLPAAGITPPVNEQQLLTGTVNGKQHSILVILNADQHKISLAGLSPLGIRLFLLTYDATGIHTRQSLIQPELPPANQVLADIMLSHWPVSAWQAQLPAGWTLRDADNRRELRNPQGKLIIKIDYLLRHGRPVPIALTHYVFNYHIGIQYTGN